MSDSAAPSRALKEEVYGLATGALCGELTEADARRLERLVIDDPTARRLYYEFMCDACNLRVCGERAAAAEEAVAAVAEAVPHLRPKASPGGAGSAYRRARSALARLVLGAIAAMLIVGVVLLWHAGQGRWGPDGDGTAHRTGPVNPHAASGQPAPPDAPAPSPEYPARLIQARGCRWSVPSPAPQVGGRLRAGQPLELASGVAEIEFVTGATMILQGPALLRLESATSARLDKGKATVEIAHERARGFRVITPEVVFVDQGTEFGVEVTPSGSSKVHVFKGLVDVDQKAREGQPGLLTHRLAEYAGARMPAGEVGMILVEEAGDYFIRSMEEAGRDQHVVAYWRFEDRPVGILLPDTGANSQPVCATVDSSFNGNDLYAGMPRNRPMFSADVPAGVIPQHGGSNRSCLDTSQAATEINRLNLYTHSEFSHASPLDIQKISPAQWTVEVSVKAARLVGKAQGFLGRDANFTYDATRAPARLAFQIDGRDRFSVGFRDAAGRFHEAVAAGPVVRAGQWYHLAATSDGRVLRLYVDALDGRGYVERAATALPADGSTALGKGQDNAEWTLGRCGNAGVPADWPRFWGWIDEVRISDVARRPAEFLFAPETK